ncbi:MAG: glycosyltransferase [Cyclobacteriaceae bacterium]
MNKVKIGFYFAFGDVLTGGPNTLLTLFENLDRDKFEPILITQKKSILVAEAEKRKVKTIVLELPEVLSPEKGEVLKYNVFKLVRSLKCLLAYNKEVGKVLDREGVHVLWMRNVKSVLLAVLGARANGIPRIWDIALEYSSRKLVRFLHVLGLILCDKVVTESPFQHLFIFGRSLMKIFDDKLTSIDSALTNQRFEDICKLNGSKQKLNSGILTCVGLIGARKNQLFLVESIKLIHERFGFILKLVGPVEDEEYMSQIQAHIDENNLEELVVISGWRDDIPEIIAESSALILMSYNEGVPHVIKEAMLVGTPVIASPVGGIPDIIHHGRTGLISNIDSNNFIETVGMLTKTDQMTELSENARSYAIEHFNPLTECKMYEELFLELHHESKA